MRVIEGEDVNELYWRGMNMLRTDGRLEGSRVGPVKVMPEAVTSVYRKPRQRVLLDHKRRANPFFHLFESLWMLSGRNDVAALNRYITDFGTRFAEPNGEVHGAYGHRWRNAFGFDQLNVIVDRLKKNPRDRQCVLQMWDATVVHDVDNAETYQLGCNDLLGDWKDRPCNTHVYFRLREEDPRRYGIDVNNPNPDGSDHAILGLLDGGVLDMLVSCRSNDIVYGAYGANAVHFSILHEYMAGRVGAMIGKMEQLSYNYHAYVDVLERVGCPAHLETYAGHEITPLPMAKDWDAFDKDLTYFMSWQKCLVEAGVTETGGQYVNPWFRTTAEPMFLAHFKWRNALQRDARDIAETILAEDWRFAALAWFDNHGTMRNR